jgi:peptide/nickel transport system permease protein
VDGRHADVAMTAYIVRRIGQALLVVVGISIAAFALIHLTPGDPATTILGSHATPRSLARLRQELGLNRPLIAQYLSFIGGAVHLDFGTSISQQAPVSSLIGPRVEATLFLTLYASVVAVAVAIPLGVVSGVYRNRSADHGIRLVTMITFAMPVFWLGLVLILIFNVDLHVLPSSGYGGAFVTKLKDLTLPAFALGLGIAPMLLRSLRSSLAESLASDYVEAARARGLSSKRVLMRHALRSSLLSSITILGVNIGILLGGIVVVENVFVIPGLGSILVSAITNRDFPVIEALTVIFGVLIVAVNLATDLTYALVDPRVRLA